MDLTLLLLLAFVATGISDIATTIYGINNTRAREGNPIIGYLSDVIGLAPALVVIKSISIVAMAVLVLVGVFNEIVIIAGIVLWGAVSIRNAIQITRHS